MKKIVILTFLCFLFCAQNLFAQNQKQPTTLDEYGAGCLIAIAALTQAPDYDEYDSDREFCRDSAEFYYNWARYLSWLGQVVRLPANIDRCHDDIVASAYAIASAYRAENYLAVGIAKTALGVATVQMADELDRY